MDKETTISSIEKLLSAQEMLLFRIKNGIYNNRGENLDQILNQYTDFVEFFRNPKHNFRELMGGIAYDNIMTYANNGLEECARIYYVYFTEPQGFFKKIKFKDPSPIEIEKAKSYHKDLLTISEKLIEYINIGLQRLNSLDKDKFK